MEILSELSMIDDVNGYFGEDCQFYLSLGFDFEFDVAYGEHIKYSGASSHLINFLLVRRRPNQPKRNQPINFL
jgi:hypothetical protein